MSLRNTMERIGAAIGLRRTTPEDKSQQQSEFPGRPPFGEGEKAALSASRLWLRGTTERDAATFALGEERRFMVDQPNQILTLTYVDGEILVIPVEALGSFNPHNRTFRWAWSNPSVDPRFARASEEAKAHPDVRDFEAFSTPMFQAMFDECHGLVAHAAKLSGCCGAYRAITEDHVSVFLGYRRPSELDIARIWRIERATELDLGEALSEITAYDAAMLPFDLEYQEYFGGGKEPAVAAEARSTILAEISLRQIEAQRRFWRRDNEAYDPVLSWPSPHDPRSRSFLFAAPRRAGGVYVVRGSGAHHREAFVLKRFPEGMRIIDSDADWGAGLLLP